MYDAVTFVSTFIRIKKNDKNYWKNTLKKLVVKRFEMVLIIYGHMHHIPRSP